jgi:hypothetical protein
MLDNVKEKENVRERKKKKEKGSDNGIDREKDKGREKGREKRKDRGIGNVLTTSVATKSVASSRRNSLLKSFKRQK